METTDGDKRENARARALTVDDLSTTSRALAANRQHDASRQLDDRKTQLMVSSSRNADRRPTDRLGGVVFDADADTHGLQIATAR